VDVRTCLKSAKRSFWKCWLRSFSDSVIGTLVKRDTTSKLTMRSPGCSFMASKIWINWPEF
jgi:hypothetical protein